MSTVVLAYSGGLDTTVLISWLRDQGHEVIALAADLGGGGRNYEALQARAISVGATRALVAPVQRELIEQYCWPALRAGAVYQGSYYLSSALSRPLIAALLVEAAHRYGAQAVAHGCTGKGNDQVRFDVSVRALAPELQVLAPVRSWAWTRDEEMAYAAEKGIPVPTSKRNPYSIDENLWGRSIECGPLEDPWTAPPAEIYAWTADAQSCPPPVEVTVGFERATPVSLDGSSVAAVELVTRLNALAGAHGVGRSDHLEDRLVGIKSREVYEAPAAALLHQARSALEGLCLSRRSRSWRSQVADLYAGLAYDGLWFDPLRRDLDAYLASALRSVSGEVRVRLQAGTATVVGVRADQGLYRPDLATYGPGDSYDHASAEGFIKLWGLPTVTQLQAQPEPQAWGATAAATWSEMLPRVATPGAA